MHTTAKTCFYKNFTKPVREGENVNIKHYIFYASIGFLKTTKIVALGTILSSEYVKKSKFFVTVKTANCDKRNI